jgi:prepilin-type N-terminal cleavage/methylation domain-containing protein
MRRTNDFTLVELLVVIAVILLLMAILPPTLTSKDQAESNPERSSMNQNTIQN